ncbi:MAG: glycosyltransferase family A protein [Ginsengibacter sp.]
MKRPFFTVVIASYNRALLVKRAIESLLVQTETNWEAIIIDDGSSDDTAFQIVPFLRLNRNIEYIYQDNKGAGTSKNTGIFKAKGEFITFLDSDDEYLPEHLSSRKEILLNNPSLSFLHGGIKIIGNEYVPDRFDHQKKVHLSQCVIGGTFFVRNELAQKLKGFRKIDFGSDADFFERISQTGIEMRKLDLPTYVYHRNQPDSVTNTLM